MDSIPVETTPPTHQSAVTKFVSNLPMPYTADLREEQKTCHICMERFTKELPVRLPCGHVFGKVCMIKWLSSDGDKSPRSCPMCRAELLPQVEIPMPPLEDRSGQIGETERLRHPTGRTTVQVMISPEWRPVRRPSGETVEGSNVMGPVGERVNGESLSLSLSSGPGLGNVRVRSLQGEWRPDHGRRSSRQTFEVTITRLASTTTRPSGAGQSPGSS